MKRILSAILILAMIIIMPVAVSAESTAEQNISDEDQALDMTLLRWEATYLISHGVTINSNGKSNTSVTYQCYNLTHKIDLTVTLQKLNGSVYEDYQTWTVSGTGTAALNKDLYVGRGTYRVKTVGVVTSSSGRYIETVTVYSDSKVY